MLTSNGPMPLGTPVKEEDLKIATYIFTELVKLKHFVSVDYFIAAF